jgi:hypothetical protein
LLGFGDHPTLPTPTVEGTVGEVFESSNRLARLFGLFFDLGHQALNAILETAVFGQSEHVVHAVFLTPLHDALPSESAVGSENDLGLRPLLAEPFHDPLDLRERSL